MHARSASASGEESKSRNIDVIDVDTNNMQLQEREAPATDRPDKEAKIIQMINEIKGTSAETQSSTQASAAAAPVET